MTALFALLFAVIKGIRFPGTWSLTQAALNYSQGWIKRGLEGTLVLHAGVHTAGGFMRVFALQLALAMASLLCLTWKSRVSEKLGVHALPAMFFGSFAITYLANMIGYLDLVLIAMGALLLTIVEPWKRLAVALPVCLAAILLHESFTVAIFPVVLLSLVLGWRQLEKQRAFLFAVVVLVAACTGLTTLLSVRPALSPDQVGRLRHQMSTATDFPLNEGVIAILSRSASDNARITQQSRTGVWAFDLLSTMLLLLPLELFLLWLLVRYMGRWAPFGMVCSLAPLALHLAGWDVGRWNVLCVVATYLTLCCATMNSTRILAPATPLQKQLAVVIFALGLASGGSLFDHTQTRYPPFPEFFQSTATHLYR